MNILNVIKGFIGTHKLASIITASVVGVGAIGGTTAGIVYAVNHNNDSEIESEAPKVNTTELVANQLEGQEVNLADMQDVTEEVQADGTSVIKDKNGTIVAKKDASGKTTLTKEGATSIASGNVVTTGSLANTVADTSNKVVASLPSNTVDTSNNTYIASIVTPTNKPSTTQTSTPSASTSTPTSTPASTPISKPSTPAHTHTWQTVAPKYKTVHHDAEYGERQEPIKELKRYKSCDSCGYKFLYTGDINDACEKEYQHEISNPSCSGIWTNVSAYEVVGYNTERYVVKDAWDEQVLVENGYTYCTGCGERR